MNVPQFEDDFIKASELLLSITRKGNESFGRVIKKINKLWLDPEYDLTEN